MRRMRQSVQIRRRHRMRVIQEYRLAWSNNISITLSQIMDNQKLSGVSVIVPTYNREQYLKECLDSILAQEYNGSLEIVVCDDGSTDKTLEIAESYGPPVVVLRKPEGCTDQGAGPTRNRGIAASTMPLIAFLDSDDWFLPGHLNRLAETLFQSDLGFVYDETVYLEPNGGRWTLKNGVVDTKLCESFFSYYYTVPSSVMIPRQILDSVNGFDETLLLAEDTDLFLRILEKFQGRFVAGEGCVLREHDSRSVRNLRKVATCAEKCFQKAIQRFPYPSGLVRKRRAAIHFYYARADFQEKKYLSGFIRLLQVYWYDPTRAFARMVTRFITFFKKFNSR